VARPLIMRGGRDHNAVAPSAAGTNPPGKKGPHAFRHARAVSLLRSSASLKVIGDVLGHRSVDSTAADRKLATEDLRAGALEIPGPYPQPIRKTSAAS